MSAFDRVETSAWSHLAVTYDAANIRLYVNGTQVATQARTGAITTSANPLQIGGNTIWNEWFSGWIDEVKVYNRALAATEITSDMNTPVGGGSSLRVAAPPTSGDTCVLGPDELAVIADEAKRRWMSTGLTLTQTALLSRVQFVTDLDTRGPRRGPGRQPLCADR